MLHWQRHLLTIAALFAPAALPLGAQNAVTSVDAARYAARRESAYSLLGSDLLIVLSRWSMADATRAGFDQDPTFYYYTGLDNLKADPDAPSSCWTAARGARNCSSQDARPPEPVPTRRSAWTASRTGARSRRISSDDWPNVLSSRSTATGAA